MFRILGQGHFQQWAGGQIGHPAEYWYQRETWLDCRGPLFVHPTSEWGYNVTVVTASHSLKPGEGFRHVFWPVIVEARAWVCSNALLYNCKVGEGAVVCAGAVVRSRDVPPGAMVEGNPARVIALRGPGGWEYLDQPRDLPTHAQKPSGRQPSYMEQMADPTTILL